MRRELHVRFCEGGGVQFPSATRLVILCRSEAEACQALEKVRSWTITAGLLLHPTKTQIVDATQGGGFDFLGYHFERGKHGPRRKSLDKLKDAIRAKTRRLNGQSLPDIIANLNRTLCGWFEYYKHSRPFIFADLDRWVRGRLRSILRRRRGGKGCGRGWDNVQWPPAFFAKLGLFSLVAAHALASPSSPR